MANVEHMEQEEATRLPTEIEDGEDPVVQWEFVNLSMRQLLTLLISGMLWFGAIQTTTSILPIATIFAVLLWSWIFIGGLALALVKREGVPLEEYLSWKIDFMTSKRRWVFRARDLEQDRKAQESEWEELDEYDFG